MVADAKRPEERAAPAGGTGLCSEAQADGVPCSELGRDCEICERAVKDSNDQDDNKG
jgi:hypothetical protein